MDLFINFFTAIIDDKGYCETSLQKIAMNYMANWFLIDFISSIPIELI
jgi:hypothetical protein